MPYIHIRSLPFEHPRNIAAVVEGIARDFAKASGIALDHVSVTWNFLAPGHYAVAGTAIEFQRQDSHPVLVDLLAPDFNPPDAAELMLHAAASGISQHAGIAIDNIFIEYRQAHPGMVFDAGAIVRW